MLVPDGMNWTSDDQCEVMYAADFTSSAGTVTGTLDVVNGSMADIGSLTNGLAALGAMDGIPGGTSHDRDGIVFLESCHTNCSDEYVPVCVASSTLSCGSNGFLVTNAGPFYLCAP